MAQHRPGPPAARASAPRPESAKEPYDYFHVNSVDLDRDGNVLISARNTSGVYKLSRATGAILWRLGGKRSDFDMGPGRASSGSTTRAGRPTGR